MRRRRRKRVEPKGLMPEWVREPFSAFDVCGGFCFVAVSPWSDGGRRPSFHTFLHNIVVLGVPFFHLREDFLLSAFLLLFLSMAFRDRVIFSFVAVSYTLHL